MSKYQASGGVVRGPVSVEYKKVIYYPTLGAPDHAPPCLGVLVRTPHTHTVLLPPTTEHFISITCQYCVIHNHPRLTKIAFFKTPFLSPSEISSYECQLSTLCLFAYCCIIVYLLIVTYITPCFDALVFFLFFFCGIHQSLLNVIFAH